MIILIKVYYFKFEKARTLCSLYSQSKRNMKNQIFSNLTHLRTTQMLKNRNQNDKFKKGYITQKSLRII